MKLLLRRKSLEEQVRIGRVEVDDELSMWNLCIQPDMFSSKYGAQEKGER